MCFSAGASFATAGALSVVSLLSIQQVIHKKKLIPLALTPLFFGIQQACEGFVWITINNGDTTSLLHIISMYSFLFFAGMFWPIWIPGALYYAEKAHKRKLLLGGLMCVGGIVSMLLLHYWILQTTGAKVINHHIDYPVVDYPNGTIDAMDDTITHILNALYGAATIAPFFISSVPHMKILGSMIGISALIAYIFYLVAFPSVWCFFAAVCSLVLYGILRKIK